MADAYMFIISQVGSKDSPERRRANEVLEYVIKPVASDFNLNVERSDLDPTPGQITSQIIRGIIGAEVVIADVTGRNPNVYYELGVAQAFGKPTILLVGDTASLPFDVKNERMIPVGGDEKMGVAEAEEAKKNLTASLRVVLADDYEVRNVVTETAGAQSLNELAPTNPIATELRDVGERLDDVFKVVANLQGGHYNDLLAFIRWFDKYTDAGTIPDSMLGERLTTTETTERHNSWVQNMTVRAKVRWDERRAKEVEAKPPPAPSTDNYGYDEEPF